MDAVAAHLQVDGGRDRVEVAGDRLNHLQVPGRPEVAHAPQHLAPVGVRVELAACHKQAQAVLFNLNLSRQLHASEEAIMRTIGRGPATVQEPEHSNQSWVRSPGTSK